MTAVPRTLPIRVMPVPGEALDSWLEALAARLQATPADLAAAMLPAVARTPGKARPASTIMLNDDEAAAIAGSCQLSAAAVHGLTLARYDGVALRLDRQSGRVVRNVLWGRAAGSRFCPECLAQTGGRWQLAWRLGWSFACLHHGRLLADACPQCGRMQRRQPHPQLRVPSPGSCACPAAHATGAIPPRCGADLAAARTLTLAPGHPVLAAQQFIDDIITTGHATAGIYASSPQPAHAALADVRALAATILGTSPGLLATVLPADIAAEHAAAVAMPHERHSSMPTTASIFPGSLAPASAAVTAAAVTAAARPLASRDPREAADGLRRAFRAEEAQAWSRARAASPALHAVRLAALGRMAEPSAAGDPAAPADARAWQTPALFWPAWTARLMPPLRGTSPQGRRRCLSAAFLTVTAGTSLTSTTRMLGGAITYSSAAPTTSRTRPALARLPHRAHAPRRPPRPARHAGRLPAPPPPRLRQSPAGHPLDPDLPRHRGNPRTAVAGAHRPPVALRADQRHARRSCPCRLRRDHPRPARQARQILRPHNPWSRRRPRPSYGSSPYHLEAEGSVQVAGAGERFVQDHLEADLGQCGCCTLLLHLLG